MKDFLDESAELQAGGQLLKEIFLECILSRARKSLEHIKRFIEIYYNEIFEPWFVNGADAKES